MRKCKNNQLEIKKVKHRRQSFMEERMGLAGNIGLAIGNELPSRVRRFRAKRYLSREIRDYYIV